MAKNRLDQLIQQLESYPDVFVLDAIYEGDGLYSLKLQTPRHVYLDTGTFRDWIALVQDDIRHRQQSWHCPFCHHLLSHSDHTTPSHISCPKCPAQGWRIDRFPSDVPKLIYDQFCAAWTPAEAYQALMDQDSIFILKEDPDGTEFLWIHPSSLTTLSAAQEWPQESLNDPLPLSSEIPVYFDLNYNHVPNPETIPRTVDALLAELSSSPNDFFPYQLATCYTCRHVLPISGPSLDEPKYFCQYPLTSLESLIEREMVAYAAIDVDRQSLGQLAINQLCNLILDHALQPFPAINDDAFEGYIAPLNHFHSPVCSRYHENPEALEFDDLMTVPVTLPVTFNVVNVAKIQQQKRLATAQKLLPQTIERLTALKRDPEMHRLMTRRITIANLNGPEAQAVIAFMHQHIPDDLVQSYLVQYLKRFFNLSNAAWNAIVQSLRQS